MRNSEYRIFLDVQETRPQVQLTARPGDSLRRVRAVLFDHGLPFVQPVGSRAVMIVRLPDGTYVMADCEIYRDGTVVYDFTETVTAREGVLDCVLEIRSAADEVVAAPKFNVLVTAQTFDDGARTAGIELAGRVDALDGAVAELREAQEEDGRIAAELREGVAAATEEDLVTARYSFEGEYVITVDKEETEWVLDGSRRFTLRLTDGVRTLDLTALASSKRDADRWMLVGVRPTEQSGGMDYVIGDDAEQSPELLYAVMGIDGDAHDASGMMYVKSLPDGRKLWITKPRGGEPAGGGGRVYDTAADMAAAADALKPGMQAQTLGRFAPRDGGARTYMIADTDETTSGAGRVHNPLAIELAEGLYAIPVIGDHVTALDIGLRRGLYGENPPYPNDLPRSVYADNDNISAQNSARFQKYLDNLPSYGIDDSTDAAGTYAPMRQIHFPAGVWGFRDPIVLGDYVSVVGVPRGTNSRGYDRSNHPASYDDSHTAYSRLVFLGRELYLAEGNETGTEATAFVSRTAGQHIIISPTPGDQPVDKTVTPEIKATACIEYSFIYAGGRTLLKDLEICGYDNYYWANAEDTLYNDTLYKKDPQGNFPAPKPYTDEEWGALVATRDPDDPGAAHYCYHTFRKQRKISGVTHAIPKRDENGKIIVKSSDALDLAWKGWLQVDGCDFYQWSRSAIRACVVDRIKNCTFAYNHIGIEMVSHDLWIMDVYISRGDIGILSRTHTTTVSNSFIDFMAEFGVCTERTSDKVVIMGSGDKRWVKREGYRFKGYILVDYDLAIEFCQLGAYAAEGITSKTTIRGKLVNNGLLYCTPHTRIVSKSRYHTYEDELKVTDAIKNHADALDSGTLIWDYSTHTWETAAEPGGAETLGDYHAANLALFQLFDEIENAHIVLEPTSLSYYGLNDADEERLSDIAADQETDTSSEFYAYVQAHPIQIDIPKGEPGYEEAYSEARLAAYLVFLYGDVAKTLEANRDKNFYALLGTSHINVRTIWHLESLACIEVRMTMGKDWGNVDIYGNPKRKDNEGNMYVVYNAFPISGFNYVRSYHGVVACLFEKNVSQKIEVNGAKTPITMRRSFAQGTDNIYFVPMERKMEKAQFCQERQYGTDSRDSSDTDDKMFDLRFFVTAQGLFTGSVGGYVNFSEQRHATSGNHIGTKTFLFSGISGMADKLGQSFAVPVFALDDQAAATDVEIDGVTVSVDAVARGDIVGVADIVTNGSIGWVTIQPVKRYVGRIFSVKF